MAFVGRSKDDTLGLDQLAVRKSRMYESLEMHNQLVHAINDNRSKLMQWLRPIKDIINNAPSASP